MKHDTSTETWTMLLWEICGGPKGPTLGVAGVSELQTQGHQGFTGRVARASLEAWQFS